MQYAQGDRTRGAIGPKEYTCTCSNCCPYTLKVFVHPLGFLVTVPLAELSKVLTPSQLLARCTRHDAFGISLRDSDFAELRDMAIERIEQAAA